MNTTTQINRPRRFELPFVFFAGMVAWLIQLFIGYGTTLPACTNDSKLWFYLISLLAGVVAVAGIVIAWRNRRQPESRANAADSAQQERLPDSRDAFVMLAGIALNTLFLVLIAGTTLYGALVLACPLLTQPMP